MEIIKSYHFYAAHRNENLEGKCENLHGHTYYVTVHIEHNEVGPEGVTILFEDIDRAIDPIIKTLDHTTLIHKNDHALVQAMNLLGGKVNVFDFITSAENLCKYLFEEIGQAGMPVVKVILQETTSSKVSYP